jgi:uncharacterized glyoxalase superfamily protein PhnB
MNETATTTKQATFPALAYDDAPAAIEWLGRAFGFRQRFATPVEDGKIMHAELEADGNVIMLGSTGVGLDIRSPRELGGATQCMYLVVEDPDAHHRRAREAGAEIVRELNETDYGSREYVCRDLEGHLWGFGTYDPLA